MFIWLSGQVVANFYLNPVPAGGHDIGDGHLVGRDGPGLVAADDVEAAQRLHRWQLLHDCLAQGVPQLGRVVYFHIALPTGNKKTKGKGLGLGLGFTSSSSTLHLCLQ